jgi:3-deoxy-7-phosphoheptulonate synthase
MLIVMKSGATEEEISRVAAAIREMGYRPHVMPGATRTAIGLTGNQGALDPVQFENLPGVAEAIRVSKPYKLVTLDLRPEKTVIRAGEASIGGDEFAIIAGPCAVEDRETTFAIAEAVQRSGAKFFRGGACKPRTSPYAFQGLGDEGWKILSEVRENFGLKIVAEALDEPSMDQAEQHADIIQIGARNMQNFSLLRRAGQSKLPVLLKRGMAAMLDEWLLAAEYVMAEGNYAVVLCERGVRTLHLPVIVDPSHGTGKNYMVTPLACAGTAAGADGLIVEVHSDPARALSDGAQALTITEYEQLVREVMEIQNLTSARQARASRPR